VKESRGGGGEEWWQWHGGRDQRSHTTPRATLGWDHERWISAIPRVSEWNLISQLPLVLRTWSLDRERETNTPSSARGSESTSHDAKTRSQSPDGEDSAFIPRFPLLGGEALFSGYAARVRTIYSIVD
ncbi:hypothetical protein CTAM01_05287, partial [Colletotrichum tamarilloi]